MLNKRSYCHTVEEMQDMEKLLQLVEKQIEEEEKRLKAEEREIKKRKAEKLAKMLVNRGVSPSAKSSSSPRKSNQSPTRMSAMNDSPRIIREGFTDQTAKVTLRHINSQ